MNEPVVNEATLERQVRILKEHNSFLLNLLVLILAKEGSKRIDTAFYVVTKDHSILTHRDPVTDDLIIELQSPK